MIRLYRAEASRLLSRRFTHVTLLAVLIALGLFQIAVNSAVSPPTTEEVAANRAEYQQAHQDWEANHSRYEQECIEGGATPAECASYFPEPQESDFGLEAVPFAEIGSVAVPFTVYLSALALFLLATSFIGAEYTTGAIANWLSFVPRRGAVFAAKLLPLVFFAAVVTALACGLTLGVAALLTRAYGGPLSGLSGLAAQAGRGIVVGVILAVIGFCVGLVTRHTAAAIGVLLGYLFLWFVRNGLLFENSQAQRLTRWSAEGNLAAILGNGHRYQVPTRRLSAEGVTVEYVERTISLASGLVYWAVLLAVLVVGSLLVFRRRDVT